MKQNGVREFFEGKTIFITGGSGFIGKVLIEKLLYSCPAVKEILVLFRAKKGKTGQECFEEVLRSEVFNRIKHRSDLLSKITPVFGDVTKENLGLLDDQLEHVVSSSNVVFHIAASLKMDAPLSSSIESNLKATKNVLDLCKKMKNLLVVLHLSTAFCNCDQEICDEKVYDLSMDPKDLINCAGFLSEELTMKSFPNSYIFTKRMAEILVRDEFNESQLNVCIARPSIVMPAWSEPIPGFVDSLNGPVGVLAAAGKGILRTMMVDGSVEGQIIFVDHAVSGMIAIAASEGSKGKRSSSVRVFNLTNNKKMTWESFFNASRKHNQLCPFEPGIWYPDGDITMNPVKHYFLLIFTMWLPALIIDFLLLLTFQRRFMIRMQKKIFAGLSVLQFFTTRNWIIRTENFEDVIEKLSEEERKIFEVDFDEKKIEDYFANMAMGIRKFCLKESLETVKRSRILQDVQFLLDLLLKVLLIYFFGYWLLGFLQFTKLFITFVIFISIIFMIVNRFYERHKLTSTLILF